MSLMPDLNPYVGSLALGLVSGLAFCSTACLPYVTSYIAGIGAGFRKGILVTSIYNVGRVTAYALIGALIGLFKLSLSDAVLAYYQQYMLLALGVVSIVIGVHVILKSRKQSCNCPASEYSKKTWGNRFTGRFDLGAFSLGLTRGLIMCPILTAALITYSITTTAPLDSFLIAVLFGIGTALSPILLLTGGATGWLLSKAPLLRKWISAAGGLILIALGVSALINASTFTG